MNMFNKHDYKIQSTKINTNTVLRLNLYWLLDGSFIEGIVAKARQNHANLKKQNNLLSLRG
jgi:hypothetical protein